VSELIYRLELRHRTARAVLAFVLHKMSGRFSSAPTPTGSQLFRKCLSRSCSRTLTQTAARRRWRSHTLQQLEVSSRRTDIQFECSTNKKAIKSGSFKSCMTQA
jgi:hypothetical protein